MTTTIQINTRGGMTLLKEMRRAPGLENGGVIMAQTVDGGILLRPAVAYPIEIYTDERVAGFDRAEEKLREHLRRKARG